MSSIRRRPARSAHLVDDLVLRVQSAVDRVARWARLGAAPSHPARRFVIVQIDGLSARVLDQALATGHAPTLARMLRAGRLWRRAMSVGMPSSTPAFQASIMYGVRGDIPGFHFYDKRARLELHFPRRGVAAWVERDLAEGRRGILEGGACFGCVFTGGARESFLTFARLLEPTRAGLPLLRPLLSAGLLGWVVIKCLGLTALELFRFARRGMSLGGGARASRLKALWLKVGLSIWVRQFFTLAVSADLYRGLPAIYVNYLDYDVFAHAFGPGDPAALRALRRVDRSIGQIARVIRRLPELGYDLYVCSDHGQTPTRYFRDVSGGASIADVVNRLLRDTRRITGRAGKGVSTAASPARADSQCESQALLDGEGLDTRAGETGNGGVAARVIAAGPNAFVYFTDTADPLLADEIERRYPQLLSRLSAHTGVGFLLVRSASGPVCWWRGRPVPPDGSDGGGPFAARPDRAVVLDGLRDLMAMPSAGDIVLYGTGAPGGDVSFIAERGAHAGPSELELQTFILHPASVSLPADPITHPVQLYPHFAAYADPLTPAPDSARKPVPLAADS